MTTTVVMQSLTTTVVMQSLTTQVVSRLVLPNRGIKSPLPVISQYMRQFKTSVAAAKCAALSSAVGIFNHLATVCLGTPMRRASSDAVTPRTSIAIFSRSQNTGRFSPIRGVFEIYGAGCHQGAGSVLVGVQSIFFPDFG